MYQNLTDQQLENTNNALLSAIENTDPSMRQGLIDELKVVYAELIKRNMI